MPEQEPPLPTRAGHAPALYWVKANNRKTGPVITAYPPSRDAAWRSCAGCPMRGTTPGTSPCYAWKGTANARLSVVEKQIGSGAGGSLAATIKEAVEATAIRFTAIGDAARLPRKAVLAAIRAARSFGLRVLAYTHFWRDSKNETLRTDFMASCDGLADADLAIRAGWRPAVVLPPKTSKAVGTSVTTPAGHRILVCPAETKAGKVTCNTCGLCDAEHPVWKGGKIDGIGFVEH